MARLSIRAPIGSLRSETSPPNPRSLALSSHAGRLYLSPNSSLTTRAFPYIGVGTTNSARSSGLPAFALDVRSSDPPGQQISPTGLPSTNAVAKV